MRGPERIIASLFFREEAFSVLANTPTRARQRSDTCPGQWPTALKEQTMSIGAGASTKAVHAGDKRLKPDHALTTPVVLTSTFTFEDVDDLVGFQKAHQADPAIERSEYGRYGNPTIGAVERKLAELDRGEAAILFSSGMAAVTVTLLSLLSAGAHVVITDDCYRRTREFVLEFLPRYGIQSTKVPMGDYGALEAAICPETRLLISESPTNPYLRVVDLPRLVGIARKHGPLTVIDSTFATPINQRPLEYGVDVVIHSATKYLGGHNDLLGGAITGSSEIVGKVRETENIIGAISDPHAAYLLLRGLKTLALRVRHQNETGMQIARFLEQDAHVAKVFYPGLESHPDHAVATQQMAGFGGVVSFELDGDLEKTKRFVDALRIPYIGPSLGGTESLVLPVALSSYFDYTPEERSALGISDTLIRLAVGVEDGEDLIADLTQALEAA
jgi:cystathionine gamma-synthase